MNALHSAAHGVPVGRVVREHRAALVPLAVVFALNIVFLVAVVLPLSRSVAASEQRLAAAERERDAAEAEFKQAESLREGKGRVTSELDTFYQQVLPSNVTVARRLLQLGLQLRAREHGVDHQRSSASEEELRGSTLRRLSMETRLSGDYDDIRALIYNLETSPEFIVIDSVALAEGEDSNAPLSVSMGVSTYYRTRAGVARAGTDGR